MPPDTLNPAQHTFTFDDVQVIYLLSAITALRGCKGLDIVDKAQIQQVKDMLLSAVDDIIDPKLRVHLNRGDIQCP